MNVIPREAVADPTATDVGKRDDVSAAIYMALARLTSTIANRRVKIDVAACTGLRVRMHGPALVDMLEEFMAVALHVAPASRLLLTAAAHDGRVHVSVTDDIPSVDMALRQSRVKGLTERAAMRGDALVVDVRQGEGTTMTLRLEAVPAAANTPVATQAASPEPRWSR